MTGLYWLAFLGTVHEQILTIVFGAIVVIQERILQKLEMEKSKVYKLLSHIFQRCKQRFLTKDVSVDQEFV